MGRELKISFTFILIYFVFGLSSLLSLGDFVTPYFFSKLSLVLLSLIFLVLNIRSKTLIYHVFAVLAMISRALMDDFSLNYLALKFKSMAIIEWANQTHIIYLSFILFYLFYIITIYLLWKLKVHKMLIVYFLVLLIGSIFVLSFGLVFYWELLFTLFLLSYFILTKRILLPENSVMNSFAALFIFQVAVESMKYLYL
jgi:hypothetical protein